MCRSASGPTMMMRVLSYRRVGVDSTCLFPSLRSYCHLIRYRKSLDKIGANMEVAKYTEKLVPSTRFVAVDGVAPMVAEYGTFVAPSASVIGNVTIGRNSR